MKDQASGDEHGHMEWREGDKTVGTYYVNLPDGRRQVVNYEADSNGYRPEVTYVDLGNGKFGGYNY